MDLIAAKNKAPGHKARGSACIKMSAESAFYTSLGFRLHKNER
jgi:hypothetical protein